MSLLPENRGGERKEGNLPSTVLGCVLINKVGGKVLPWLTSFVKPKNGTIRLARALFFKSVFLRVRERDLIFDLKGERTARKKVT